MRTVTVKRYPSMQGQFQITNDGPQMRYIAQRDSNDPGEAAAIAIEYALQYRGRYVIVGPKEVMDFIPTELRTGNGV